MIRDTYHAYIKRDVTIHSSSGNETTAEKL